MLPRNLTIQIKLIVFFFGDAHESSSSSLSLMAPPLPSSEEDDDDDDKEMTSSSSINDNDSIVLISPSSIAEYRRERDAGPVAPTGTTTCSPIVDQPLPRARFLQRCIVDTTRIRFSRGEKVLLHRR